MYTPQYWHLVVKMSSNLTDLTLDLPADQLPTVLTSSGQDEFTFGRSTPRSADRSTPTPSGQDEFKFGRSTPRSASRSTPHYWHLMVKMTSNLADLPSLLLTSCGQDECIFGRSTPPKTSTDIWWSRWVQIWQIYPLLLLTSCGQDEFKFQSRWVQIWQTYP